MVAILLGVKLDPHFPDGMERPEYYLPVERGFERELSKRLSYFKKLRTKRGS